MRGKTESRELFQQHVRVARGMAIKAAVRNGVEHTDLIQCCLTVLFKLSQKPPGIMYDGQPFMFGPTLVRHLKWSILGYLRKVWSYRDNIKLDDEVGFTADGGVRTVLDRLEDRSSHASHQASIAALREAAVGCDLEEAIRTLPPDEQQALNALFTGKPMKLVAYNRAIARLRAHFKDRGFKVAAEPVKRLTTWTATTRKKHSAAVMKRNHLYWHVRRRIKNPKCSLCRVR